jgi:hypothetical protein
MSDTAQPISMKFGIRLCNRNCLDKLCPYQHTTIPTSYHIQTGTAHSVKRLAISWAVRGSNPGEGEISASVQTGPGDHPAFYAMGIESLPKVKRGFDHSPPPPYSTEF